MSFDFTIVKRVRRVTCRNSSIFTAIKAIKRAGVRPCRSASHPFAPIKSDCSLCSARPFPIRDASSFRLRYRGIYPRCFNGILYSANNPTVSFLRRTNSHVEVGQQLGIITRFNCLINPDDVLSGCSLAEASLLYEKRRCVFAYVSQNGRARTHT